MKIVDLIELLENTLADRYTTEIKIKLSGVSGVWYIPITKDMVIVDTDRQNKECLCIETEY